MTPPTSVKEKVLQVVAALPPDATIEDVIERLYFLAKVERGLVAADRGDVVPHEEARRRLLGE